MPHIQIRNVPPRIHRTLKARAALEGTSLSEYLLRELRRSAETPTVEELIERIRSRELVDLPERAAEIIRHERRDR